MSKVIKGPASIECCECYKAEDLCRSEAKEAFEAYTEQHAERRKSRGLRGDRTP